MFLVLDEQIYIKKLKLNKFFAKIKLLLKYKHTYLSFNVKIKIKLLYLDM